MITVSPAPTIANWYENGPGKESSLEDSACAKVRKKIEN